MAPRHPGADRRVAEASEQDQAGRADHGRDRKSTLQREGEGTRRLGRSPGSARHPNRRRSLRGCPRADGASARTPSTSATSTSISGAGRPGRSSTTTRSNTGVVCFITVAGFLNGPASRRCGTTSAASSRRHLGHRLLARRPPTRRPHPIFQGVQQPDMHRRSRRGPQEPTQGSGSRPIPFATGRATRGQIRALQDTDSRQSERGPTARRVASSVPADVGGRVGDLSRSRRPVRLQRLRRNARPHLGHCTRCGILETALANAH